MFRPENGFLSYILSNSQDNLRNEVKTIIDRDAKHALKSPNANERQLGVRALQSFLDY